MYKCARCNSRATIGTLCAKHAATPRVEHKRVRYEHHDLYSSRRWRAIREQALSRDPLCMGCNYYGMTTPAEDVDHIWPAREHPSLHYTLSNLQPLCKGCHSRKTGAENKGVIYDYRRGTITHPDGRVCTIDNMNT